MGHFDPKRIIIVGAGATGICFSKFAETQLSNIEVQIYDKNHDIGGTWLENRYPGCACDIPSVTYQFSWSTNPNWSDFYSSSEEIWEYLNGIVERNGLRKYMKLRHTVLGAKWSPQDAKWIVQVERPDGQVFEDRCDFFINGSGLLNNWKWPDIKGLKSFRGPICHSAAYDTSLDVEGKRVAVIGSGSSSIQIVAAIQPKVKQLHTWVRSQIWVTPGFAQTFAGPGGMNMKYSQETKDLFNKDPAAYLLYQKQVEASLAKRFGNVFVGTPQQKAATQVRRPFYGCRSNVKPHRLADSTFFSMLVRKWNEGSITDKNSSTRSSRPSSALGAEGPHRAAGTSKLLSLIMLLCTRTSSERSRRKVSRMLRGLNTKWMPSSAGLDSTHPMSHGSLL